MSSSDLPLPMIIKGKNGLMFFHPFLHFVPALHYRQLILFWGLAPGITWVLESSVSCSNRLTALLLPWLFIITEVKK